jgi:hypothetical protein
MPNAINSAGLTIALQPELYANLSAAMMQIYGADINLESDSPDGQWLNINIQSLIDVEELIMQVNSMFDPDQAVGVILNQRVGINGITRQAGTYTTTPVTVINSVSVNLYGLDQTPQPVYTLTDPAGNFWELMTTVTGLAAGTHVLEFQCALPGAVTPSPNTITIPVTVVLGVESVNNPTTYSTLGLNEETDAALKIRRQKSVSQPSQGYLSGLYAGLENIPGMASVQINENNTASTDVNGTPSHTIWVIVSGSAAPSAIAQAIYVYRNAGAGMRGNQSYVITQADGSLFTVSWDNVIPVNVFIKFTVTSLNGVNPPNTVAILAGLPVSFVPGADQEINVNALATQIQIIDPNTLVTFAGFSNGQTQILTLSGVAASGTFQINYNGNLSAAINWNDPLTGAGSITSKIQAVSGLSTVVVTGSIASQTLTFDLTSIPSVLALLYVVANSLATSGAVAITFSYNEGYTPTLSPVNKQYQFVVASADIIIVPILLTPQSAVVAPLGTQTFVAAGGYGTYIFSISSNLSGGSINASTGLYTAGSTPNVTDTVEVIDGQGNIRTVSVSVT